MLSDFGGSDFGFTDRVQPWLKRVSTRRAGWVGCNFDLRRIPAKARIAVVSNSQITPAREVREKFQRVKPLQDISVKERGWTSTS